jgi:hypothetical protein
MENYQQTAINNAEVKIAVLEEKVQNLSFDVKRLTTALEKSDAKQDQVLAMLSEARGGWKMMMAVGGGASAITGFIAWAASHIK